MFAPYEVVFFSGYFHDMHQGEYFKWSKSDFKNKSLKYKNMWIILQYIDLFCSFYGRVSDIKIAES